jgi:hypothetical protein
MPASLHFQVVGTCAYGVDFKAMVSDQELAADLLKAISRQSDANNSRYSSVQQ